MGVAHTYDALVIDALGELQGEEVLDRVEDGCGRDEELPVGEPSLALGQI